MGRKRVWTSDAERMRAARVQKEAAGVARVELQLGADAREALAKLARQQRATPSEVVERLLRAAVTPAKRARTKTAPAADQGDMFS